MEAVVCDGGQSTLADYAAQLDLPVATVHRHVQMLTGEGFLVRTGQPGLMPGPRLCRMAPYLDERYRLARVAAPLIDRLARKTGFVVQLGTLDQDMVTYRLKRGEGAAASFTREGMQLEAYCSAIGKVLLAHLPQADRDAYLANGPFPALTTATITDPSALSAELAHVRATGHAIDAEEVAIGLRCLAVPLHGEDGSVVAALSLSRHTDLDDSRDDRLLLALNRCASAIVAAQRGKTEPPRRYQAAAASPDIPPR